MVPADGAPENTGNVPKIHWQKCDERQPPKVAVQEGLGSSVCPQRAALTRSRGAVVGRRVDFGGKG